MITISISRFKRETRKYLEMAKEQRVILHAGDEETYELVPQERIDDFEPYFSNANVQRQLDESIRQKERGEVIPMTLEDIDKRLGL